MTSNAPSQVPHLESLALFIRHLCLTATSTADSGHLTSSLSAADLMTGLLFGGTFRFKVDEPDHPGNDRLIFSKGHASPLFYALWAAAGGIDAQELASYRQFGSRLEGHPTPRFRYAEAATGSLSDRPAVRFVRSLLIALVAMISTSHHAVETLLGFVAGG